MTDWIYLSGGEIHENQSSLDLDGFAGGLAGRLKPGESMEGWLAFGVKQSDSEPVMVV